MQQYLELLEHILIDGVETDDRTGVGTISVFGDQLRFDLSDGFPLVTTKKVFVRGIIHELLWFLNGDTNIKYLNENGVHIWDPWADDKGNLGPIYGAQWTAWRTGLEQVNQIESVVNQIKADPHSRRHIVASWNVSDLPYMALPPCHCLFQFYVAGGKLSCQLYQRSADAIIGTPFNIASYALLTMMVAQVCDLEPGEFIHTFGDVHIYKNHIDNANLQLEREPYPLPTMGLNPAIKDIFGFSYEDFTLSGYRHHPAIKSEVAV